MIHHNQADFSRLEAETDRLRVELKNKEASLNNGDILLEKAIAEREFAQNQRRDMESAIKQCQKAMELLENLKYEQSPEH